ncbi:hypothetical protein BD410DRAFT_804966 [Rickenella mellea]|uniref:Nephrocystin 3-like N-terminal domain-containing protein n=1 Tax=Rickenella mellea TaxID=50990 RepID=A0A4Y7PYB3_9AGAM|nr:hypothetical protein BD410DRAFT_804966 [Rickenella mellea]
MPQQTVEDGVYKIVNAAKGRRNYIILTVDGNCAGWSDAPERLSRRALWNVKKLENERYFICALQGGGYTSSKTPCETGSPVVVQSNVSEWIIDRTRVVGEFVICHVERQFCWGLAGDVVGTPVVMRYPFTAFGNQWLFEKFEGNNILTLPPSTIDPPIQQIRQQPSQAIHAATMQYDPLSLLRESAVLEARYDHRASSEGCLKGTREAVISNILGWTKDINGHPICWLSGPAGSGKSAIAQEVAAQLDNKRQLLASFFFRRGEENRSNSSRLISTLAFQLSVSMPGTKALIQNIHSDYPLASLINQPLRFQFEKLLVPLLCAKPHWTQRIQIHKPLKVIIIDALDECDDKQSIEDFVEALCPIIQNGQYPFRFFFTSRVEEHVRKSFALYSTTIQHLSLEDFDAHIDIHALFQVAFRSILDQNSQKLDEISKYGWPSDSDLEALVKQSSGLFIFASTLIKHVKTARQPHIELQKLLKMHHGIDPLYTQVLSAASHGEHFNEVFGTVILLQRAISIIELAQLLQLSIDIVLDELFSVQSIIKVPANNQEPFHLMHQSLRDFSMTKQRSGYFFIDPPTRHAYITAGCLTTITNDFARDKFGTGVGRYACENWCHHFLGFLTMEGEDKIFESHASKHLIACLEKFEPGSSFDSWINTLLLWEAEEEIMNCLDSIITKLKVLNQNIESVNEDLKLKYTVKLISKFSMMISKWQVLPLKDFVKQYPTVKLLYSHWNLNIFIACNHVT